MVAEINAKIARFIEWMRQHGVESDRIELKHFPAIGGYGIVATRTIRPGERILEMPLEALITSTTVLNSPDTAALVKSASVKFTPSEALALFIHVERSKPHSTYRPYLDMLPETFTTPLALGLTFDVGDLPAQCKQVWENQCHEIEDLESKFKGPFPDITREEVLWAWHVVNTRSIFIENLETQPELDNTRGDNVAVIPLVDMLNHVSRHNIEPRLRKDKIYEVESLKTLIEGEELYVTYGDHGNDKLWFEYGFTLEDNILNKVPVSLDLFIALTKKCGHPISNGIEALLRDQNLSCTLFASDEDLSSPFKRNVRILFMKHYQTTYKLTKHIYADVDDELAAKISALCRRIVETLRDGLQTRYAMASEHAKFLWKDQLDIVDRVLSCERYDL